MPCNLVKITKQQRIHEELTNRIFAGILPSGSLLPTFSGLCREFNASRWTVNAALRMLEHDGLICTRASRPARVTWQASGRKHKFVHRRIALIGNGFNNPMGFSYKGSAHGWLLYRALIYEAAQLGWSCVSVPSNNYIQVFRDGEYIDGTIQLPTGVDIRKQIQTMRIPHVWILPNNAGCDSNAVEVDYAPAMEQSALYFLAHGVKKVVIYGFKPESIPYLCQCRQQNFDRMLLRHGIPEAGISCEKGEIREESGRKFMEQLLQEKPALPLGILAIGDFCGRGMAQAALQTGLQPKRDFLIVGMTDLEETAHWSPALSVQSCPYDKIAMQALNILERSILSKSSQPSEKIPSKLVIRET